MVCHGDHSKDWTGWFVMMIIQRVGLDGYVDHSKAWTGWWENGLSC